MKHSRTAFPEDLGFYRQHFGLPYLLSLSLFFLQVYRNPHRMDMELAESQSPPDNDKSPGFYDRQRTIKDESVIARFGKRQQLHVSAPSIILLSEDPSLIAIAREVLASSQPLALLAP